MRCEVLEQETEEIAHNVRKIDQQIDSEQQQVRGIAKAEDRIRTEIKVGVLLIKLPLGHVGSDLADDNLTNISIYEWNGLVFRKNSVEYMSIVLYQRHA